MRPTTAYITSSYGARYLAVHSLFKEMFRSTRPPPEARALFVWLMESSLFLLLLFFLCNICTFCQVNTIHMILFLYTVCTYLKVYTGGVCRTINTIYAFAGKAFTSLTSRPVGFIFSCNFLQFPDVWYLDVQENYFDVNIMFVSKISVISVTLRSSFFNKYSGKSTLRFKFKLEINVLAVRLVLRNTIVAHACSWRRTTSLPSQPLRHGISCRLLNIPIRIWFRELRIVILKIFPSCFLFLINVF